MPTHTHTRARRLRRAAATLGAALVLVLGAPTAAWADATTKAPVSGTGGTAVSVGSGIVVMLCALFLARHRGAIFIAVLAFAAGAMLSGSQIAESLAGFADSSVHAIASGITGAIA